MVFSCTNTLGTNDYYAFNAIAGSYYIIISGVGSYSSRFSYKLNYSVNVFGKENHLISEAVDEFPEGYAIWKSDFVPANESLNNFPKYNLCQYDQTYTEGKTDHSLFNKYYTLGDYPILEIYFWGPELRDSLVELLENIIAGLTNAKTEIENYNSTQQFWINVTTDIGNLTAVVALAIGEIAVLSFPIGGISILCSLIASSYTPVSTMTIDNYINYYTNICTAIYNVESTLDDNFVFAVTVKANMSCSCLNSVYTYNLNFENNIAGSRFINYYRYENSNFYDTKQYDHNSDGIWTNIYGKVTINNNYEDLYDYFDVEV